MAVTWNPSDTGGSISLSGGNLTASSVGTQQTGQVRANTALSGLVYFEVAITAGALYIDVAFANLSFNISTQELYNTTNSFSWSNDGFIYYNGTNPAGFPGSYTTGDRLCWAINVTTGKAWWRKNNGSWQSGDPAAGTGGYTIPISGPFYAAVGMYSDAGSTIQVTLCALASSWSYSAPSGFSAYDAGTGGTALTGQSATGSRGTMVPANSQPLTGQAGTTALGSPTAVSSRTLTGQVGTGAAGTLSVGARTVALTGVAATGATGTLTASQGGNISVSLTGQSATGSIGSLALGARSLALTGLAGTSAAGSLAPSRSQALSGQAATGANGTISVGARTVALTGLGATASKGLVSGPASGGAALTGFGLTGSIGTLTPFHWQPVPPTDETWTPIPVNDETWTPIASTAANWS